MSELKSPKIYLNLNVRGLDKSATLEINETYKQLVKSGKQAFNFGLGQSPFPVPSPVVEELRKNAAQKDYLSVEGLPQLRTAVAQYYQKKIGSDCSGSQVLIGPGSKELMFILQLTYYGDLVIPTPSWVSYAPQAHIVGRPVRWLQTYSENDWRLMPEELEKLCAEDPKRPRLVILNYPSNPTGRTYSPERLQELAEVARKYRVIMLSDEIYGELNHQGRHTSIAQYYPEGTIISSGLSKWCGAGGWRLGTFLFPSSLAWLQKAMSTVASETYTSTSAPIQYAAVRAFECGEDINKYLDDSRRVLRALASYIQSRFESIDVKLARPEGGFYVFPDFRSFRDRLKSAGIRTSNDLCKKLLQDCGLACLPGSSFGRPIEELTLRLAYVDFDGTRALDAAAQVPSGQELDSQFIKINCERVVSGIDTLCSWTTAI